MDLETYWEDVTSYYIELVTVDDKIHNRLIVLPANFIELQIPQLLLDTLPNVKYIVHIDQWASGWIPRKEPLTSPTVEHPWD